MSFSTPSFKLNKPAKGTVILLTLMMLVLLTFEVAVISLVAQRGFGEEGMLYTQNIATRRAGEIALNRIEELLYNHIRQNGEANVETLFANGGANDLGEQDLMITNPTGGTNNTDIKISAWLEERRGVWYHIIGRAKGGGVDLVSHRWIKINPCQQGTGGLTTIITGQTNPGHPRGLAADSNGRVFFGEDAGSNVDTLWTWHEDTGLSTVLSNINNPAINRSIKASPVDDRFYIGSTHGAFWTWKAGVLSTLVTGQSEPGYLAMDVGNDGRVYFAEAWMGNGANTVWSWKEGVGLSTLGNYTNPGYQGMHATRDGGVAFGEYYVNLLNNGKIFYWKNGSLSTVVSSGVSNPGYDFSIGSHTDGRLFFGEGKWSGGTCTGCQFYTWKNNVLTSLITANFTNPGMDSLIVSASGRAYWGETDSPGNFWSWHESTGLSTVVSNTCWPGEGFNSLDVNGRLYVGSCSYFWTWQNNILSTIRSSTYPGDAVATSDGTVYFGEGNGGTGFNYYSYKPGVGLSTIMTNVGSAALSNAHAVTEDDRIYVGEYAGGGSYWTWKNGVLSTILGGATRPGANSMAISGKRVFFGEQANPGMVWTWAPPTNCSELGF